MNDRPIITGVFLDQKATKRIIRTAGIAVVTIFGIGFYKGLNFKGNIRKRFHNKFNNGVFVEEES